MPRVASIFADKEKLLPRHIPAVLRHRERAMQMLQALFDDFLDHPGETYQRVAQLLGPTGTGKTCTISTFGIQYQRRAKAKGISLQYVHVNCKLEAKTLFALYQSLLKQVSPEVQARGQSTGEMLRTLVQVLRSEGRYLLLALDDVDNLIRRSKKDEPEGGVVYDLTRLNEFYPGEHQHVVGVVFIARDSAFRSLLDPSERSTLGNIVIRLSSYDSDQLKDILSDRVNEAFVHGTLSEEIIEYVADLTAENEHNPGDCRFALDILLTSGFIADYERSSSVSVEHVRRAVAETFPGISSEDLLVLEEHGLIVLTSAVQALQSRKTPYVPLKNVHDYYRVHCEECEIKPLSYSRFKEVVFDLNAVGAVDYRRDKGVNIAGASLDDLSRVLKTLERREDYSPRY